MVSPGPEGYWFKILDGSPAGVARDPAEGGPGSSIALQGSNCTTPQGQALTTAKVHLAAAESQGPIASAEFAVTGGGTWAGSLTIPTSTNPGSYELWARCWNDSLTLETARASFKVTTASSPSASPKGGKAGRATPSSEASKTPRESPSDKETVTPKPATSEKGEPNTQLASDQSMWSWSNWATGLVLVALLAAGGLFLFWRKRRSSTP